MGLAQAIIRLIPLRALASGGATFIVAHFYEQRRKPVQSTAALACAGKRQPRPFACPTFDSGTTG
jgi:hypothetical protein